MKSPTLLLVIATTLTGLAACGGSSGSGSSAGTSGIVSSTNTQSTVNFVVTDTPSTNITVLSFQIDITGAVLQPGSVSLLPKPVTVDLAQLVSDTAFLSSTVVGSATYTSLQLSYANPQVTIENNTGGTLTLRGQSCAAGATCTFTPVLNNASVTISSGIFPLTLTASSSSGLNLDLSIPDLLQSDLSVTFANGTSVNLAVLGDGPVRIDDMLATVNSVGSGAINVTTAFGNTLVLDEGDSSAFKFPGAVCAASNASCVAAGQTVAVDASLGGDGKLTIDSMSYVGQSGAPFVKGLVLSSASGMSPAAQVLLRRNINAPTLSPGQVATVALAGNATYAVATASYPTVTNANFAAPADLLPGQEVILAVGTDLVAGSTPTFTTSTVYLQSSQVLGDVATVDSANSVLTIDSLTGLFTASGLHVQAIDVQTDASTTFVGFSSLAGISPGKLIVAKGPLLNVAGATSPTIAAVQVRGKS